jgi:hypothetical protein
MSQDCWPAGAVVAVAGGAVVVELAVVELAVVVSGWLSPAKERTGAGDVVATVGPGAPG